MPLPETVSWSRRIVSEGVAFFPQNVLTAAHVELSATNTTGDVEGYDLCTEKIISSRDVRRNLDIDLSAAVVHVFGAPVVIGTRSSR